MVGTGDEFLDGVVFVADVEGDCGELYGLVDVLYHLLSTQVVVVAGEVDDAVDAVGEHCVVVACRDHIHRTV